VRRNRDQRDCSDFCSRDNDGSNDGGSNDSGSNDGSGNDSGSNDDSSNDDGSNNDSGSNDSSGDNSGQDNNFINYGDGGSDRGSHIRKRGRKRTGCAGSGRNGKHDGL